MQNRFVIITNQRSGSNMLVSMLDSHPEIKCFGELMRATPGWMRREGYRGALRVLEKVDPAFREDSYRFGRPYAFVEAAIETSRKKKISGFKLHLDQHQGFLQQLLKDPGWKVVVLRRENCLAQYSSQKITQITGQGNAPKGTKIIQATVEFKPREFEKFVSRKAKEWGAVFSVLEAAGKPCFRIQYTELLSRRAMGRLLDFFEVDASIPIEPGTEKRNPSDILARFSNPEEASAMLAKMGKTEWCREVFPDAGE